MNLPLPFDPIKTKFAEMILSEDRGCVDLAAKCNTCMFFDECTAEAKKYESMVQRPNNQTGSKIVAAKYINELKVELWKNLQKKN